MKYVMTRSGSVKVFGSYVLHGGVVDVPEERIDEFLQYHGKSFKPFEKKIPKTVIPDKKRISFEEDDPGKKLDDKDKIINDGMDNLTGEDLTKLTDGSPGELTDEEFNALDGVTKDINGMDYKFETLEEDQEVTEDTTEDVEVEEEPTEIDKGNEKKPNKRPNKKSNGRR